MGRLLVFVSFVTAAAAGVLLAAPPDTQNVSPLAGAWTLNRSLSEMPPEIGFDVDWISKSSRADPNAGSNGAGRGRGSGGGGNRGPAGSFPISRESYEDARRVQLVTAEARNPPMRLMVVDTTAEVTITDGLGQSRIVHPNAKEASIEIQGVSIGVTAKRDGDRLVLVYRVEQGREVRYTYSYSASPSQLIVEVQFLDHGAGDKARRVYEPAVETEPLTSPAGATMRGSTGAQAAETFDARPGAELRGLKSLGILIEDLSAPAVACGLSHAAIEAALSKRLTDGGFAVRKNSDEDTYVYVNVMTTTLSDGTCVSRYDAFLYTHATAKLSYHDQPVLVQVSLMHRGGLGASAPTGHAAAVARGLESYVDLFVTQIHDANK
jgi:hypothetical protein